MPHCGRGKTSKKRVNTGRLSFLSWCTQHAYIYTSIGQYIYSFLLDIHIRYSSFIYSLRMIGVVVCLDYTCLLDNAEENIRSKFYSIIATLAAFDGILMNTSVAVFQSHNDDNHQSARQLPCNSTDLNRPCEMKTIGKRDMVFWFRLSCLFQRSVVVWTSVTSSKVM